MYQLGARWIFITSRTTPRFLANLFWTTLRNSTITKRNRPNICRSFTITIRTYDDICNSRNPAFTPLPSTWRAARDRLWNDLSLFLRYTDFRRSTGSIIARLLWSLLIGYYKCRECSLYHNEKLLFTEPISIHQACLNTPTKFCFFLNSKLYNKGSPLFTPINTSEFSGPHPTTRKNLFSSFFKTSFFETFMHNFSAKHFEEHHNSYSFAPRSQSHTTSRILFSEFSSPHSTFHYRLQQKGEPSLRKRAYNIIFSIFRCFSFFSKRGLAIPNAYEPYGSIWNKGSNRSFD